MTLTFDFLTSGSIHTEVLSWTVDLPSLVLIARAVFRLERGHTERQTHKVADATDHRTHGSAIAGVGS